MEVSTRIIPLKSDYFFINRSANVSKNGFNAVTAKNCVKVTLNSRVELIFGKLMISKEISNTFEIDDSDLINYLKKNMPDDFTAIAPK